MLTPNPSVIPFLYRIRTSLAVHLAISFANGHAAAAILESEKKTETEKKPLTIVITAQKTPQDEREVPLSVTTVDGDRIARQRIEVVDELSRYIANTQFNQLLLYMRGIGTGNTFGFEPSVGTFIDGVYMGRATAATTPLWDLAQTEIIRGPQGTVLGKNTLAGAINFTTAPVEQQFAGNIAATYGKLDPYRLRATLNQPLSDEWGLRLSTLVDNTDGFVFNTTRNETELGRRNQGLRAKLAWQNGGPVTGWLSLEHSNSRVSGFAQPLSVASDESLALYRQYDPATEADDYDFRASSDFPGGAARHANNGILKLQGDIGLVRITSLSNMFQSGFDYAFDPDYSPVPLLGANINEGYRQWSQELRLNVRSGYVDYLLGGYYFHANLDVRSVISALPQGTAAVAGNLNLLPDTLRPLINGTLGGNDPVTDRSRKQFAQDASNLAAFTQVTWQVASRWSLMGGVRWTQERKNVDMRLSFDKTGLLFTQFLGEEAYRAQRQRVEEDISPRLALQYAMTQQTTLYAVAARGFKSGGYNDFAPRPESLEYQREQAESLEAGLKSLLLDESLAFNVNLFDTRVKDIQVTAYDGTAFYVQNAARAHSRGVELDSRWRLGRGWSLVASLGTLDARYVSFPNAPARADQEADSQDLSGAPLVRAPKTSGAVGLEYEQHLASSGLRLHLAVDALYRSHAFLNLDNDPLDAQSAHTLWNASLGLGKPASGWTLRLNALNLSNQFSRLASGDVPIFTGNHSVDVNPPRRYSLSLDWRW